VPNWRISRNYKNIWNSTKDSVSTGLFVTCRQHGAKPQVKGAQGPAGWHNPMASRPQLELVSSKTWPLHSYVGSQEYPILESQWKLGGVADQPRGWPPGHPSPPNRLNQVGGSSPRPLYKDIQDKIHIHHSSCSSPLVKVRFRSRSTGEALSGVES
jgi:hypothetical protein